LAFCNYATEKNRVIKIKTNETCLRKIKKKICTLPRIIVKNAFKECSLVQMKNLMAMIKKEYDKLFFPLLYM
jgi:hypothetical protein